MKQRNNLATEPGQPVIDVAAVLFDLDDTLWPIVPVIRQAEQTLHDWLTQHVPAVTEQWSIEGLRTRRMSMLQENPRYQIDLWGLRHAGLTEAFIACNADHTMVDEAMGIFAHARNQVTLFDDVLPALERIGVRAALGSISNGSADLAAIGLAAHFRVSLAAHSFGRAKPDPAIFHAACAALAVDPAQAVYVGDDLHLDVVAAQNAGMRAVWINRFERDLPADVQPDAICTDLFALEQWLTDERRRA